MTRRLVGLAALWVVVVFAATWWWLRRPVPEPPEVRVERLLRRPGSTSGPAVGPADALVFRPVACPMILDAQERTYSVSLFADAEGTRVIDVIGEVRDSWLHFRAPTAEGAGLVTFWGYEPLPLVWWTEDDGQITCHFPRDPVERKPGFARLFLPPEAATDPDDHVTVDACIGRLSFLGDTREYEVEIPATGCDLRVCRRRGEFERCALPQFVRIEAGATVDRMLDVPDPPEGAGLLLTDTPGGLVVSHVHAGGPAEQVGIVPGLVVHAVNGQPVSEAGRVGPRVAFDGPAGHIVLLKVEDPTSGEVYEVEVTSGLLP